MSDATQFKHYMSYPMCGFCTNAWDIIYARQRSGLSCEQWLDKCKVGGCDPDVWEYIDTRTGWPLGWKIDKATGRPKVYQDEKLEIPIPEYDDRVFHMRKPDRGNLYNPNAPWRKISERLRAESIRRKERLRKLSPDDPSLFDDDDEDLFDEEDDERVTVPADLDDPDLWD